MSEPPPPHVLREYALLADGERGVLVGPRGEFAWMCFPRWDSEPVFAALIGGDGTYGVTPRARFVWGGHYEPGTLIWRSRWVTHDALVECREALAVPARGDAAVLLRRVIALEGEASVDAVLDLRAGLARADDGSWSGRAGDVPLRWTGAPQARMEDGALRARIDLRAGEQHDLVLVLGSDEPVDPGRAWEATEAHWRERVPPLPATGAAERDARHAYAVLEGLTGAAGGAVAAATTSLPERATAGRNYDYRYVWIRDQCYIGQAVASAGPHRLLGESVRFVRDRLLEDGDGLTPAYTAAGGRVPGERHLGLPGYPGGSDVVGNHVNEQFQLDAFGEALLLLAAAGDHDALGGEEWRAAEAAAGAIARRRHEPDAGIWELDPERWTHSRLICAAGLRAIARQAPRREQAAQWTALADAIVADAAASGLHPSGRWQRAPDDPRVDAALLLGAVRGAVAPDDPSSVATLAAVAGELTEDGYCYRYRADDRPLGTAEGAFLLCGFWLALAHLQRGDAVAAARWFERNRAACGPPGLLSEEFDVRQRQLRGNLPQAFVHALLIETAVGLARA
jgi:GH15 family glucan-1,4-alpha-glucosidase